MEFRADFSQFEIIGSTIAPTPYDLPLRLTPVLRHRHSGECAVLQTGADDSGADEEWLRPLADENELGQRFATPLEAVPGHWLVQLWPDQPPVCVPRLAIPDVLRRVAQEALDLAAVALSRGDRAVAEENAWYASRALPDEPAPFLIAVALARPLVLQEAADLMDHDVRALALERGKVRLRQELERDLLTLSDSTRALLRPILESDTLTREFLLPAYLPPQRGRPNPLVSFQRLVGRSARVPLIQAA